MDCEHPFLEKFAKLRFGITIRCPDCTHMITFVGLDLLKRIEKLYDENRQYNPSDTKPKKPNKVLTIYGVPISVSDVDD